MCQIEWGGKPAGRLLVDDVSGLIFRDRREFHRLSDLGLGGAGLISTVFTVEGFGSWAMAAPGPINEVKAVKIVIRQNVRSFFIGVSQN